MRIEFQKRDMSKWFPGQYRTGPPKGDNSFVFFHNRATEFLRASVRPALTEAREHCEETFLACPGCLVYTGRQERQYCTMNQPPPPPTAAAAQPKNSGVAIWSLVLGILSITCFSILAGIPAVICGHTALGRIKRSSGLLEGKGLAIGGLITGYMSIALIPLIGLMAAIAIPNFVQARNTAMKNACINNLRMIDGAKQQWALEKNKQNTDVPTEAELTAYLGQRGFPQCPAGGHYTINTVGEKPSCSTPGHQMRNDSQ